MSPLVTWISPSLLLDLALKSAAVMLLAVVAAALLSRASAAWRHLVWSLSVLSLLGLPVLSLALPAWRVRWMPELAQVELIVASPPRAAAPSDAAAIGPLDGRPEAATQLPPAADAPAGVVAESAPLVPASAKPAWRWSGWLAACWLAGAMLSFLPLVVGMWQLTALHRSSRIVRDQGWLSLLGDLRRQLGVRRSVQLRQTSAALVPLTWGAWRPVMLVPAESDAWPRERRRLVLLHELAHIRRWDWLTQILAHAACAVYWFNPLVWWAAQRMRIERERACDDLVLASGAKASDYAQELLSLAAGLANSRVSTLVAVPMARRGALEDRLRGILDRGRSRAALTTAAIGLSMALVAAVVAPLAMLRAAPPKPQAAAENERPAADQPAADQPAAEKPAQRDPTPEEIEARKSGIRISVLNSTGDKGIPEFRVIAGVSPGGVTDEFEKKTGQAVINWQPHTCRMGKEGDYVWPLAKAYDEMALRVEADGYQPQVFTGLKKANGVQHIVFMLAEDKGLAGRVLTPAGKPAAGATVAMGLARQDIVWEEGKLRGAGEPLPDKPGDRWQRSRFVTTDAEGRFRLPTEFEPAAILVVHESGVRELAYDAWQKSPEVNLERWGSIAGQILLQDKPGADENVSLIVHRHDYGYPGMIASYATTRTNKEGRFTFDKVLPGQTQISRPFKPADADASGISAVILNGMFRHVTVLAGDPTPVLLGGQGCKVTGKLAGLDSWDGVTYHFHPTAPHVGFPGDDASWKAFGHLKQSPSGALLFRDKQPVGKDGTFTIENMLPGDFQLFVSAPGFANHAAYVQVKVDPEVPGRKPADLDLGVITVKQPLDALKPAAEAPQPPIEKPAEKPAAKTVSIRGKVVDDETGKPIERLITQAGKFDPADPSKVTWGYSEGRSSSRDGSFSTSVRWGEGWTARILADGYVPQPVLTSAPPADKDEIELTIRLKRGRTVRGVVLDHAGQPLRDAAVFAIGPTGLNLAAGQAWSSIGGNDDEARPVRTDDNGRFELPVGEAKTVAVSHATLDAWPATIPATGEITIRLPEPARVEIELNIDGANKDGQVFYQLLTHLMPEFAGLQSTREIPLANPGKLTLAALPPGKYQICRSVINRLTDIGTGAMLDREFFEVKAGQTKAIRFVREKGARLSGKYVEPTGAKLSGVVIAVRGEKAEKGPLDDHSWRTTYASHTAAADGTFLTERIAPGTYLLVAEAFTPLTPEQQFRTGAIGPSFRAERKVEVPAEGELAVPNLELKPTRPGEQLFD